MPRAFSDDLRSRVLARDGMSARAAAARFGIGISTAIAWIACAQHGQMTPAKQGRRGGSRLDAHGDFIVGMIEDAKDITLNEMVLRLAEDKAALDVWLRKRGGTFKKDRTCTGAGTSAEASSRLVRWPARSGSCPTGVHR